MCLIVVSPPPPDFIKLRITMKKTPWRFPLVAARLFLLVYALICLPTHASNTSTRNTVSLCPKTNSFRVLIASSGPVQAVAESEDLSASDSVDNASIDQTVVSDQSATKANKKRIASSIPLRATPPIDMTVKQTVVRPSFIPSTAYTNDEMIAPYREVEISESAPQFKQELPRRIKLDPKVARHWNGAKVLPYWVNTTPDKEHPGIYSFCSEDENGPRGWLQHTGERSAWGHPEYRYWFNPI